jgi:hypothetical protein
VTREGGHGERFVRIDEVEAVMRDASTVRGGGLRGPDVEPPVDLAGVGRDDGGGPVLVEIGLGEPDRKRGLAGGRRAGDDDEGRNPRTDG